VCTCVRPSVTVQVFRTRSVCPPSTSATQVTACFTFQIFTIATDVILVTAIDVVCEKAIYITL
jgi:hypothetical protein